MSSRAHTHDCNLTIVNDKQLHDGMIVTKYIAHSFETFLFICASAYSPLTNSLYTWCNFNFERNNAIFEPHSCFNKFYPVLVVSKPPISLCAFFHQSRNQIEIFGRQTPLDKYVNP